MNSTTLLAFGIFLLFTLRIDAQEPVDCALRDVAPIEWFTPGSYPVKYSVSNYDDEFDGIYFFTANWQLDDGPIHSSLLDEFLIYDNYIPGGFIIYGDMAIHPDLMEFTQTGTHVLRAWISEPNGYVDQDTSTDTIYRTVHVVDFLPPRNELLYFGTHQDCFPCGGYGESLLTDIENTFGESVNVARIHASISGDIFAYEESDILNDLYVWDYTGHPGFVHDLYRFPIDDMAFISYSFGNFGGVEIRSEFKYPVEVTVENLQVNEDSGEYSGEVHAKFYANYFGPLSINALITEDSIYAFQNGYPGSYLEHMDILRDMTAGVLGDPTVIPTNALNGLTYVYEFSGVLDPLFDIDQIEVTGIVQVYNPSDSLDSEILNSGRSKLIEGTSNTSDLSRSKIKVFPNPANQYLIIYGLRTEALLEVYDISGRMVHLGNNIKHEGNATVIVTDGFSPGVYALRFESKDGLQAMRFEIQH